MHLAGGGHELVALHVGVARPLRAALVQLVVPRGRLRCHHPAEELVKSAGIPVERDFGEETARAIVEETCAIVDRIYDRVRGLMTAKKGVLVATPWSRDSAKPSRATGWLGVSVQPLTPELGQELRPQGSQGRVDLGRDRGEPAEKAGGQAGDIITEFDGKKLDRPQDLQPPSRARRPARPCR